MYKLNPEIGDLPFAPSRWSDYGEPEHEKGDVVYLYVSSDMIQTHHTKEQLRKATRKDISLLARVRIVGFYAKGYIVEFEKIIINDRMQKRKHGHFHHKWVEWADIVMNRFYPPKIPIIFTFDGQVLAEGKLR